MNNYELLKNKTINEMAYFLAHERYKLAEPIFNAAGFGITEQVIVAMMKQWLESEVVE